jgi:hypothetical protein
MKASGKLHAPAALTSKKEAPVPVEETERTSEPAWMLWRIEISLDNCKIESGLSTQWPRHYTG